MVYEKNPMELGTLWKKTSKQGKVYYSGTLSGQDVVGFPKTITGRDGTQREIINILKSTPREGVSTTEEKVPSYADLQTEAPF